MNAASSEARKATAAAISAGSAGRPNGIALASALTRLGLRSASPCKQRRVRRAGAHRVDVDPVAGDLAGDGPTEAHDPRLGAGVDRFATRADAAGIRGDADDAPAASLDHLLEHGASHGDRAAQVDRQHEVPRLRAALDEGFHAVPTGVVDEHVDGAESFDDVVDGAADRRVVGDVELDTDGAAADLHRGALGVGQREVAHSDPRALLGQPLGDRPPDAPRRARDERAPAVETPHGGSP